jgi:hypothetical protein
MIGGLHSIAVAEANASLVVRSLLGASSARCSSSSMATAGAAAQSPHPQQQQQPSPRVDAAGQHDRKTLRGKRFAGAWEEGRWLWLMWRLDTHARTSLHTHTATDTNTPALHTLPPPPPHTTQLLHRYIRPVPHAQAAPGSATSPGRPAAAAARAGARALLRCAAARAAIAAAERAVPFAMTRLVYVTV